VPLLQLNVSFFNSHSSPLAGFFRSRIWVCLCVCLCSERERIFFFLPNFQHTFFLHKWIMRNLTNALRHTHTHTHTARSVILWREQREIGIRCFFFLGNLSCQITLSTLSREHACSGVGERVPCATVLVFKFILTQHTERQHIFFFSLAFNITLNRLVCFQLHCREDCSCAERRPRESKNTERVAIFWRNFFFCRGPF
jgi:hypothetical protein